MLVDSEVISCRVHADVLTRHGYPITADQVRERFLGKSARDAHREVERELGHALSADFEQQRSVELLEALAQAVEGVPFIHDALDKLSVQSCVASSGAHEKIFTTLSRAGLYERFTPHIFSATQVARGKPAPDLFLFAAREMGVPPEKCLVVEDSMSGVAAAVAAGMATAGYVGGSHCVSGDAERLLAAGAILTMKDIRELPALLRTWNSQTAAASRADTSVH